MFSFLQLQLL